MAQVFSHPKTTQIIFGVVFTSILGLLGAPWWVLVALFIAAIFWPRRDVHRVEIKPSSLSIPRHLAPDVLSNYIKTASQAALLVDAQGRVTLCNDALKSEFAHVETGQAFAQSFRAPALNDAVASALLGKQVLPLNFENTKNPDQFHQAKILPLHAPFDEILKAAILVEITDVTQETRNQTMRRDFIANASHELRTPLTAIQAGLETIITQDDAVTTAHFLPIMKTQADRMQRLIDDLMSLSQIEAQKTIDPAHKIELTAIIKDVLALYKTKGGMKIENLFGDAPIFVNADGDQITQVLINLIDNALKYGAGGDKIQILRPLTDPKHAGLVGLCIKDFGKGIDKRLIPRLSERFFRASAGDKDGTGLGLAIVKHILRRHKGELQITSDINQGSEFTIWLKSI